MIPTLLVGDYLFVSKYSYGFSKYSLPFSIVPFSGRILLQPPEVGDVVVFRTPSDTRVDFIKRVVGLPGDRVQVVGGILQLNGVPVKRKLVGTYVDAGGNGAGSEFREYIETLPNGRQHKIREYSDSEKNDNTELYIVPPNHIFVMGDNRDNSSDSRILNGVGYIPFENLIGRARIIFFSVDYSELGFLNVFSAVRWNRIFEIVE
jgi:signal peptidase I (EC:3.4.21.89). Serine peptidase. MEROPS family S26A